MLWVLTCTQPILFKMVYSNQCFDRDFLVLLKIQIKVRKDIYLLLASFKIPLGSKLHLLFHIVCVIWRLEEKLQIFRGVARGENCLHYSSRQVLPVLQRREKNLCYFWYWSWCFCFLVPKEHCKQNVLQDSPSITEGINCISSLMHPTYEPGFGDHFSEC